MEKDIYRTIAKPIKNVLFKDKGSKFFGFAFPVKNEEDIKNHLETVKKEHYGAKHWCYSYQLGIETIAYRANDDGEPNNSAGMPIYGQIQSFEVTNILIIVVRYFGGVKLGMSGLINAYKTSAQLTLESSKIVARTVKKKFLLTFDYKDMNTVMRIIKEKKINISDQTLDLNCKIQITVRKKLSQEVFKCFNSIYGIEIKEI